MLPGCLPGQTQHCLCATNELFRYAILVCFGSIKLDGGCLATSSICVLVVDDFEPFRRVVCSTLQNKLELRTILEASDGVEAIELAQALQPDLILLDIGLPKLNGIEAARRIRELAPQSKILFVSQESSVDVVEAAFTLGASGYVVKMDAGGELPTAVKAVLRGERFVGSRFAGHGFTGASDARTAGSARGSMVFAPLQRQTIEIARRHEAGFYSDDASLLDGFTQFIGAALKAGNAAIVVATELHRGSLLPRLQAHGLDIGAAIEQGRYISLDAADTLSTFMINDQPDPVRFLKGAGDLVLTAAKAAKGEHPRVAACGECAPLLWEQGNAEAAVRLEQLWDKIAKTYNVDVLCGYPLGSFQGGMGSHIFGKLCAEHSAVHSR
jgi:DNA-binding NarL/FixJ family response regulator